MAYIYLMQSGEYYKIGITVNVKNRLAVMQTANPILVCVASYEVGRDAWEIEGILHARFNAKRARGEWFTLDRADIAEYHEICAKYTPKEPEYNATITSKKAPRVRLCSECGKVYVYNNAKRLTCSNKCRKRKHKRLREIA